MGIKSQFNKFLRDICPEVFEQIHISEYSYKKIAIDISLYLHKFKAVCGDDMWLSAFINLIGSLRRNKVHCVFIFDGNSPIEKEVEKSKRRDNREKIEERNYLLEEALKDYYKTGVVDKCLIDLYNKRRSPKRLLNNNNNEVVDISWIENKIEQRKNQLYQVFVEDFDLIKELFDILQVPYYIAPSEAEKMCSKLCLDGLVDAVLSEDTDIIAYGSNICLSKIDTKNDICVRICYDKLLEKLKLTKEQFLDFCILCGTDYNSNIPGVGSKNAYKLISSYVNIENISNNNSKFDICILNHIRVRELFTIFEDYNLSKIPYCGFPQFNILEKFIIKNNVKINLERIKKDFTENKLIFEDSEEDEVGGEVGGEVVGEDN